MKKSIVWIVVLGVLFNLYACRKRTIDEPELIGQRAEKMVNQFLQAYATKDLKTIDSLVDYPLLLDGEFYQSSAQLKKSINHFHLEFKQENLSKMYFVLTDVQVMSLRQLEKHNRSKAKYLAKKNMDPDLVVIYHTNQLYSGKKLIDTDKKSVILLHKNSKAEWKIKGLD